MKLDNKAKISIVIPVYNVSKYLRECLDSVINQKYQNIEIILVDDGSKDNSGIICDEYSNKDKRIKVIHKENGGVSSARNMGIDNATGKYVCFVDSDDIVHPDYIKKLVDNLDKDVLSVCKIEEFNNSFSFSIDNDKKIELDRKNFVELCRLYLLNTPGCKLFNLDIVKKNKIFFDTKLSLGEDLLFNLDYLKYIEKVVIIDQNLYYYRKSGNNTLSNTYYSNMLDIQLLLFDRFTEFFENIQMNNKGYFIYNSSKFGILRIIIENEFKNKNIGFWKRYCNVQKNLSNDKFKSRINTIHHPDRWFMYFLIKHRLVLIYKIVNKIKSII